MSNHVHLIVVPHTSQALARALKHAHGRYAAYWNARQWSSGHVWQGRFYSCPLDEAHLWAALRYAELNPVRAGMVESAERWRWSSAAAHCGTALPDAMLEMEPWRKRWTAAEWIQYLAEAESAADVSALRRATYTGRPLGTSDFVAGLETLTARPLAPKKRRATEERGARSPATRSSGIWMTCRNGERPVCVPGFPPVPGFPRNGR
jgi:putative transposase